MSTHSFTVAALVLLTACRPELGAPDYPDPSPWHGDDTAGDFLGGPDPYEEGEDRLSLGMFYEGDASEFDPADNLFIYSETFTISSSDERVEGYISDIWTHGSVAWWGGGLHWDEARDISGWETVNIDLMAPAEGGIGTVDLAMLGGDEGRVSASSHGFAADGVWHHLVIPLADFNAGGADLTAVTAPLVLVGEASLEGDQLFIDNLYLE